MLRRIVGDNRTTSIVTDYPVAFKRVAVRTVLTVRRCRSSGARRRCVFPATPLGALLIITRIDQVYAFVRMIQTPPRRCPVIPSVGRRPTARDSRRPRGSGTGLRLACGSLQSVHYSAEIAGIFVNAARVFRHARHAVGREARERARAADRFLLAEACAHRRGRPAPVCPFGDSPASVVRFPAIDRFDTGRPHEPPGRSAPRWYASEELRP